MQFSRADDGLENCSCLGLRQHYRHQGAALKKSHLHGFPSGASSRLEEIIVDEDKWSVLNSLLTP